MKLEELVCRIEHGIKVFLYDVETGEMLYYNSPSIKRPSKFLGCSVIKIDIASTNTLDIGI